MSKRIVCDTPSQELVMQYISENFFIDCVELQPINKGIRLTDQTGAVADFTYNFATGRVDMRELTDEEIKRWKRAKEIARPIQEDILKALRSKRYNGGKGL